LAPGRIETRLCHFLQMTEMFGRPKFCPGRKIDSHHGADVGYRKVRSADKLIVGQARLKPRQEMLKPKTPALCERRHLFEGQRAGLLPFKAWHFEKLAGRPGFRPIRSAVARIQ